MPQNAPFDNLSLPELVESPIPNLLLYFHTVSRSAQVRLRFPDPFVRAHNFLTSLIQNDIGYSDPDSDMLFKSFREREREMDPKAVKSTLSNLAFGNVMAAAARDYQKVFLLITS
jgi:hypothetical protein